MERDIKKVAIVTGASRGIGREIALGLAKEGYDLALIARSRDKLNLLADKLRSKSSSVELFSCDITEFSKIPSIIEAIKSKWGRIDVLVNNAGEATIGTTEVSLEEYQKMLDINFKAQLAFIQAVIPTMMEQRSGYVFNIASIAGKIGIAGFGAYCASKFALVGLNETLHNEFSPHGIKFTAICPDWVATDMAKEASKLSAKDMIQPTDIYETVRFLLSLSTMAFVKEIVMDCAPHSQ